MRDVLPSSVAPSIRWLRSILKMILDKCVWCWNVLGVFFRLIKGSRWADAVGASYFKLSPLHLMFPLLYAAGVEVMAAREVAHRPQLRVKSLQTDETVLALVTLAHCFIWWIYYQSENPSDVPISGKFPFFNALTMNSFLYQFFRQKTALVLMWL